MAQLERMFSGCATARAADSRSAGDITLIFSFFFFVVIFFCNGYCSLVEPEGRVTSIVDASIDVVPHVTYDAAPTDTDVVYSCFFYLVAVNYENQIRSSISNGPQL